MPDVFHFTPTQGGKRVSRFAVYSKAFGAGVALILNKTASEYPGTGKWMQRKNSLGYHTSYGIFWLACS